MSTTTHTVGLERYKVSSASSLGTIGLIAAVIGLGGSAAGYFMDHDRFAHAWLLGVVYSTSLVLASLFFVMVQHLAAAKWSVAVRRIPETIMTLFPYLALFFIPVLFSTHELYHWSHHREPGLDKILDWKEPFLNNGWFIARSAIYFTIWSAIAWLIYRRSIAQDKAPCEKNLVATRAYSAVGMILFGLSLTLAAYDWLMSLDPHWYSTIFGLYFFGGCVLAGIALIALLAMNFGKPGGPLHGSFTIEHQHDLGKLCFAFTVFWAYMGYSQFFLIWYANLPEETIWYAHRWEGGWKAISTFLIFGHFFFPFLVLIFRSVKRNRTLFSMMAVYLMVIHFIDLYWLIYPTFTKHDVHFSWLDVMPTIGIAGVMLWLFWNRFKTQYALPVNDPKLQQSLHHAT